jgi:DNA polymerase I-like protein with 3'-5' exonuclease and polymerase domains
MKRNGFAVREDKLQESIEQTTAEAERLKAELTEAWGINPGSSKQLIEKFQLAMREDWPVTKGDSPSTNQHALMLLKDEVPEMEKWLEWKRVEKLRSTYGTSLAKKIQDGRIHAKFIHY